MTTCGGGGRGEEALPDQHPIKVTPAHRRELPDFGLERVHQGILRAQLGHEGELLLSGQGRVEFELLDRGARRFRRCERWAFAALASSTERRRRQRRRRLRRFAARRQRRLEGLHEEGEGRAADEGETEAALLTLRYDPNMLDG